MSLAEEVLTEAKRVEVLIVLRRGAANRAPATVESLAEALNIDQSAAFTLLDELIEEGFVCRFNRGRGDHARRSLGLTDVGGGYLRFLEMQSQRERPAPRRRWSASRRSGASGAG